jgi:hypothetical protein
MWVHHFSRQFRSQRLFHSTTLTNQDTYQLFYFFSPACFQGCLLHAASRGEEKGLLKEAVKLCG